MSIIRFEQSTFTILTYEYVLFLPHSSLRSWLPMPCQGSEASWTNHWWKQTQLFWKVYCTCTIWDRKCRWNKCKRGTQDFFQSSFAPKFPSLSLDPRIYSLLWQPETWSLGDWPECLRVSDVTLVSVRTATKIYSFIYLICSCKM